MRVLYFSRDYTTHDRRFLTKLAETPFEMYFLRLGADGIPYETRALPPGVKAVEWGGRSHTISSVENYFRLMPAFEEVVERIKPDLIHAGPIQSCAFMAALSGFHPMLSMSWGSDLLIDADRDDFLRWQTSYTLRRSDMFVCDSDTVRKKAQSIVPYPDDRIVQFPWGIDLSAFQSDAGGQSLRKGWGWEENTVVLSTRAWEKLYGIDILLESFSRAYKAEPHLRLVLLSTGSEYDSVMESISRYGLTDAVCCPGQVPHPKLPQYFQAADVYVSCAHSDGTSISLLEALASGLPVVVTDIDSNREWVKHEVNGWLAKDNDADNFAAALVGAVRLAHAERIALSQRNRAIAKERADWDRNAAKLIAAYGALTRQTIS